MPLELNRSAEGFEAAFTGLLAAKRETQEDVQNAVAAILADVRARGDAALLEYTEQQYRDGRMTRRRSTALFVANPAAPCGVEWRHLQETWMEAG